MKAPSIADRYVSYANGLAKILHVEGKQTLVVTPFSFPYDDDGALAVLLSTNRNKITVSDGGQIFEYYWAHGIDLSKRREPWGLIDGIRRHSNIKFDGSAFLSEIVASDGPGEIHAVAAEFMAIASLVTAFQAQFNVTPKPSKSSKMAKSILRRTFEDGGIHIRKAFSPFDSLEDHQLYEEVAVEVKGMSHSFPYYVRNGIEVAIDTWDMNKITNRETMERRVFQISYFNKSLHSRFGERWLHRLAYIPAERREVDTVFDPLTLLRDEGIKLTNLKKKDEVDQLREEMVDMTNVDPWRYELPLQN